MFDNRVFNVNGEGDEMLLATLQLAFNLAGYENKPATCQAWHFDPAHGIILFTCREDGSIELTAELTAEEILPLISKWLTTPKAALSAGKDKWDIDFDHDGHNKLGWRIYVDDWGKVGQFHNVICAIRPVFIWYGK